MLETHIPESEVDNKEIAHIKILRQKLGRKLLNVATGGEGGKGITPEIARRVAESNTGKIRSIDSCVNISTGRVGITFSTAHKSALKAAWVIRKNRGPEKQDHTNCQGKINIHMYEIQSPNGEKMTTPYGLSQFCKEHNLSHPNLLQRGKTKGWTLIRHIGKNPIIKSLLDTDLYKLTMGQVVWEKYAGVEVEYTYACRSAIDLSACVEEVKRQIKLLGELSLTTEEEQYLAGIPYLKPGFISALKRLRLNPSQVTVGANPFTLTIKGPWWEVILFEVFLLAIISEAHYKRTITRGRQKTLLNLADKKLTEKINLLQDFLAEPGDLAFRLMEFGTRRRYSADWQEHVLQRLINETPNALFGTSNVKLAMKYKLRAMGTMAHEYLQAFQAFVHPRDSQRAALQTWADTYRGNLGIALTDVISMDAFLRDFDLYFAKLFDGLRHDSGCPRIWARKAIGHYENFRIDPKTKALVFSDGLNIPKAIALCREFEPEVKTSFGLGTNLTCDIPGVDAVNHVLKMTRCNGRPVAKKSDSPGKSMCTDTIYLDYLTAAFA